LPLGDIVFAAGSVLLGLYAVKLLKPGVPAAALPAGAAPTLAGR
jgi:hypothetical protein